MKFCEQVRDGANETSSAELGSGLVEIEPFPGLETMIREGTGHLFRAGVAGRFGLSEDDLIVEELLAAIRAVVDDDSVSPAGFVLTDGVSHGLSCLFEHCRHRGVGVLLPLPCYFGYELAALHVGVEIAGYYEPDGPGIHWLDAQRAEAPVCLVVNSPDALSGRVSSIERLRALQEAVGRRLELTVVDLICAMHGYSTTAEHQARARDLWHRLDRDALILLFGVTKDLAVPGFRAGLMLGGDHGTIAWIRQHIFARAFSTSVVVGVVMLAYFRLLEGLDAADRGTGGEVARLPARSGVFPVLDEALLANFLTHRRRMEERFGIALGDVTERFGGEMLLPAGRSEHVGYSVMAGLRDGIRGVERTLEATRALLRSRDLRVNPTYMFGGDPELWEALYPGQLHLRLNLSTPPDTLCEQVHSALSVFAS